jgi:eukaryotic-like serine/threonine-protein kinase
VADSSGANAVQLTSLGANPGFPRWSPDGRTIAFHSNSEDQAGGDVYVVPAEGGKARNLTSHPATDTFPSFSRDGRWIYFSSTRKGTGTPMIWKIPASGGDALQVTQTGALLGIESLDGADLYYVASETTSISGPLWRLPVKGGEPVRVVENVIATSFDVVDGGIYYMERLSRETKLRYFDFTTRQSSVVAGNLRSAGVGLGASRDGRTIFFSRVDSSVDDLMLVENFR